MAYEAIFLDADHTIFDYDRAEREAVERTCRIFGVPYSAAILQEFQRINAALWIRFERGEIKWPRLAIQRFEELLGFASSKVPAEEFSARYLENLGRGSHLLEDAERVCRTLATTHRLAIITNGHSAVQIQRLAASGIAECFDEVVISEQVGVQKPERKIFEIALERMGVATPESALMVGDNLETDIRGGMAAGLHTCWINLKGASRGEVSPTYEIGRISELLAVLR